MSKTMEARQARLGEILREEKRRLWTELRDELFHKTGEELHSQYDLPQDLGDQGLIDLLADTGLYVADIRREALTRMEEAERKLEEGSYGICEECGSEIDEGRLAVVPYTLYCVKCQERREGPSHPPGVTL
jgi:DnaK suppressor protein